MNKNINSNDSHAKSKWPDSVLQHQGVKGVVPFESHRDEFLLPLEDLFK